MRNWIKQLAWCIAFAIALTTTTFAQIASDNAGNYPVDTWTSGSNGGTGFEAWTITSGTGAAGFAGAFTGDPGSAGLAGLDNPSFGLFANSDAGAFVNADRAFSAPMQVGEVFSFQWGIYFDSGASGNKGFNLYTGEFTSNQVQLLNVNNAGSDSITLNGENVGFGYGTNAMTWSFSMIATNLLRVTANDRDGTGSYENFIAVDAAPDAFRFYASNLQAGDNAQPYFNNFDIAQDTSPYLSFVSGESNPEQVTSYVFTMARGPNVNLEVITLSSDNESALTLPSSITASAGVSVVEFEASVMSLINGDATITASNNANGLVTTWTVSPVEPAVSLTGPTNVLDVATPVYTLTRSSALSVSNDVSVGIGIPSGATNFASAPSVVSFAPGSLSTTFRLDTVSTGTVSLIAVASNVPAPSILSVTVQAGPDGTHDQAAYYYNQWLDGDNNGNGFGPWVLSNNNDPEAGTYAGLFVGDDFGLYANGINAPESSAIRTFDDLAIGDSIRATIEVNFLNGSKGLQLWNFGSGSTNELLEFGVYSDAYWLQNKGEGSSPVAVGWPYAADSRITITVSRKDEVNYSVLLIRSGSAAESNVYNNIRLDSAPNALRFYTFSTDAGPENNLLFDDLEIFTGTVGELIPTLEVSGPSFMIENGIATYTVTRGGGAGNVVQLVNSDPSVLSFTNELVFGADEFSKSFKVNALADGSASITATNSDATSGALNIGISSAPIGNEDVAGNYAGFWFNGDSSGKGFEPWILNNGGGGFFLASSTQGGARSTSIDTDGVSFGMYNTDAASATEAIRALAPGVWLDGSSLSFNYSFRFDAGTRGITVHDATVERAQTGYFNIEPSGYNFNGVNFSSTVFTAEREFGEVLTFTFTQNGENLDWTVTGIHPSSPNASGTIATNDLGAIRIYSSAGEGGDDNNVFFNNFMITESSGPPTQAPGITSFMLAAGLPTVTILSEDVNQNYELVYNTNLVDDVMFWSTVATTNGLGELTLTDTNVMTDAAGFYGIRISQDN